MPISRLWGKPRRLAAVEYKEKAIMMMNLLMLAQEVEEIKDESLIFTTRNLLLVIGLVALIVGVKIYKNKTMS